MRFLGFFTSLTNRATHIRIGQIDGRNENQTSCNNVYKTLGGSVNRFGQCVFVATPNLSDLVILT